jgi:hypothetical protein
VKALDKRSATSNESKKSDDAAVFNSCTIDNSKEEFSEEPTKQTLRPKYSEFLRKLIPNLQVDDDAASLTDNLGLHEHVAVKNSAALESLRSMKQRKVCLTYILKLYLPATAPSLKCKFLTFFNIDSSNNIYKFNTV